MDGDESYIDLVYGTPSPVFNRTRGISGLTKSNLMNHKIASSTSLSPESREMFAHTHTADRTSPIKSPSFSHCDGAPRNLQHLPLPSDTNFAMERAKAIRNKQMKDKTSPFKLPKHARSDFVKSSTLLTSGVNQATSPTFSLNKMGQVSERPISGAHNIHSTSPVFSLNKATHAHESIDQVSNNPVFSSDKTKQAHKRKSDSLNRHTNISSKLNSARSYGWPSSSDSSDNEEDQPLAFKAKRIKRASDTKVAQALHTSLSHLGSNINCKHNKPSNKIHKPGSCSSNKINTSPNSGCDNNLTCKHGKNISSVVGEIKKKDSKTNQSVRKPIRVKPIAYTNHYGTSNMYTSPVFNSDPTHGVLNPSEISPIKFPSSPVHMSHDQQSELSPSPGKSNRNDQINGALKKKKTDKKRAQSIRFETEEPGNASDRSVFIDLTTPDSERAVKQIQQMEKDEEMARKLQEELDKEFALSLAQQQNTEGDEGESQTSSVPYEQPINWEQFSHAWETPDRYSGHINRRRGARFGEEERTDVFQMIHQLHSELVLNPFPEHAARVRRRRRGRINSNQFGTPTQAGNDYDALLRLGEVLGDAVDKGLSKSDINRLPTVTYKKMGTSDAEPECHICMCNFEDGDAQKILPCFHSYHATCIDQWIAKNASCPVCRVEIKLS